MSVSRMLRSAACAVALASALFVAQPVLAKSFEIDEVAITADVAASGDLTVAEARSVTFEGSFTRVYWMIRKQGSNGIEVLGVNDDRGTQYGRTDDPASIESRPTDMYYVEDTGDAVTVHVFHESSDESRRFTVTYRALGAAKRWADTGELYWKLLGSETAVATERFAADVRIANVESKGDVRAWAHGPLTGVVTIADDGAVRLEADGVPPETFVEVRVVFPAGALSGAPPSQEARLDTILAEEKGWAEEANRARAAARRAMLFWAVLPSLVAIAAFGFGVFAFFRYGREHRAEFKGKYFREDPRPDLHPAVVGALWRFGSVKDSDIAATLMDLADKGIIRMAPTTTEKTGLAGVFGGTKDTFMLERTGKQPGDALDAELMQVLFDKVAGGTDSLTLADLEVYAKAHAESFAAEMKNWKATAEARADELGFFETDSWGWQIGVWVAAAAVFAFAVFGAVQSESGWPLCAAIPSSIALGVIGVYMRRRSGQGNELFRQYEALRTYLKDFSRLEEAPPSSVILWNRFLVLAVVFGVAEQVIEQLRVRLPEVVQDPAFQTSYWWAYSGHGVSPVGSLSSSFTSAASIARSEMSSSSGGGGGFSGGGGGGGGGGGFGAD